MNCRRNGVCVCLLQSLIFTYRCQLDDHVRVRLISTSLNARQYGDVLVFLQVSCSEAIISWFVWQACHVGGDLTNFACCKSNFRFFEMSRSTAIHVQESCFSHLMVPLLRGRSVCACRVSLDLLIENCVNS